MDLKNQLNVVFQTLVVLFHWKIFLYLEDFKTHRKVERRFLKMNEKRFFLLMQIMQNTYTLSGESKLSIITSIVNTELNLNKYV